MSNTIKEQLNTVRKNLAGMQDPSTKYGVTTVVDKHSHSYIMDIDGDGSTTGMVGIQTILHIHNIKSNVISVTQDHKHELI